MILSVPRKEITAAHEIGHALVANYHGCRVTSVRNLDEPELGLHPKICHVPKNLDPDALKMIFAAGVGGVMFWRGQFILREFKCDYCRHLFSKSTICYYLSRRGSQVDKAQFNEAHCAQYGRIASEPSFYMYASAAVKNIEGRKELFVRCLKILLEHGFISEQNFLNLVSGKRFDEQENRLAKYEVVDRKVFRV